MVKISKTTQNLFDTLCSLASQLDFEIYAVGGYVRDIVVGRESKDIDFVVIGDALQLARKFKSKYSVKTYTQFPRFGTCMFEYGSFKIELVTARKESYESDSRKPQVQRSDLHTDLSRRDFTINALALQLDNGSKIIDPFNGLNDIRDKIIRTPLDPEKTFSDDPLRMMRAIRFATTLGFTIDPQVLQAIQNESVRLKIISQERINEELNKIIMADIPSAGIILLDQTKLLNIFLPELVQTKGIEQRHEYHHKDVFYHTLEVLDKISQLSESLRLRLVALFHDIAKPRTKRFDKKVGWTFHGHEIIGERMSASILKRMKYPGHIIEYVRKLIRLHLRPMVLVSEDVTDSAIRRLLFLAGEDFEDLMTLCRADITSKNPKTVKRHLRNYEIVLEKAKLVEEKDHMLSFRCPVNGLEIMENFDLSPGPQIGKIKKFLEEAILDGHVSNEHDSVLRYMLDHRRELLNV
jgi:putative nucleotidyltransferase with HDIG domain